MSASNLSGEHHFVQQFRAGRYYYFDASIMHSTSPSVLVDFRDSPHVGKIFPEFDESLATCSEITSGLQYEAKVYQQLESIDIHGKSPNFLRSEGFIHHRTL